MEALKVLFLQVFEKMCFDKCNRRNLLDSGPDAVLHVFMQTGEFFGGNAQGVFDSHVARVYFNNVGELLAQHGREPGMDVFADTRELGAYSVLPLSAKVTPAFKIFKSFYFVGVDGVFGHHAKFKKFI